MRKGYFLRCHLTTRLSERPKALSAQKNVWFNYRLFWLSTLIIRKRAIISWFIRPERTADELSLILQRDLVNPNLGDLRIWFWIVWTEFSLFSYCPFSVKGLFSTWMLVFRGLCLPLWRTFHLLPSLIHLERSSLDAFWNLDPTVSNWGKSDQTSTHTGMICCNFQWPSAFQSQEV